MAYTNTPLYGGAITLDLPSNFADASQIRQIPDHQEVYLDNSGYTSIVIEILEYADKSSDEEALQYHFADLVEGTGDETMIISQDTATMKTLPGKPVLSLTFLQTPPPPSSSSSSSLHPTRKTPEFTYIHLLLLRLKEQSTDIMISINIPHYPGEYERPDQEGGETALMGESVAVRERVLGSFEVREWGLFEG